MLAFGLFISGICVIVFSALVVTGAPWYIWLGVSLILSAVVVAVWKIMTEGD